jgi:hypothetical protein
MAKTPAEPNVVHGLDDPESKPHAPSAASTALYIVFHEPII